MFAILVHIQPLNLATGQRVDVRVASSPGPGFQGLGGMVWESAISRRPKATLELFALDMASGTRTASADLELSLSAIREVDTTGLYWQGAPATIYRADRLVWPAAVEFDGIVSESPIDLAADKISLTLRVSTVKIDKPLLASEFTGGGGLGGEPDLRGTLKPAGFGHCLNIEPLMFDTTRNIAMLDGYGNLLGVDWLGEGLSDFGPSVGDYVDYAALAAAIDNKEVPPGRWATSIASGIIGLGAPPAGVITCHARFGYGMTGAMIRRIALYHAGVPPSMIEDGSLVALDAAVPFSIHYWAKDQISVKTLIEALASGCNASPVITLQNKLTLVRPFGGSRIGAFRRLGFSEPAVTQWKSADPLTPYWQIKVRVARPVRVMSTDEVNYDDTIVNRGVYDPDETYRQGNTVWTDDGAQWLYLNQVAASGHQPPTTLAPDADGLVADDWWERIKPPTTAQVAQAYAMAAPIVAGNLYVKGNIGTDQNAKWIYTADIVWDGTMPPRLPGESNAFWSLVKDASTVTVRASIAAITIQANYQNVPLDGQLPTGGRGILSVGSVVVTADIQWTVATSGCDATIDETGAFTITAARSTGYVDVRATYHDKTYSTRVSVTINAATPPADGGSSGGGGAGTSANITTFPGVSAATYPSAPSSTAFATADSAGLTFSGSLSYSASSPSPTGKVAGYATLYLKVVYRVKDSGSGWTDAAAEIAGTSASSGGSVDDYDYEDGYLDFDAMTVASVTSGTIYEFGVLLRRVGNSVTQPYGSVTGGGA